jgi:nicotinamide-nucleotide amidase
MAELHLFPVMEHLFELPVRKLSEASVFLIGESKLEGACREVFDDAGLFHGIQWGTRVQERRISLYLRGGEEPQRFDFLEALRKKLGRELVREGDVSAESLLISALQRKHASFSVAESCTGGMVGSIITSVPGVSPFFSGGCISYSDSFKQTFLNVRKTTLEHYGAVSEECAIEMAEGILAGSGSDAACSITGIAGPSGGSREKPVGTVWLAVAGKSRKSMARCFLFGYNRDSIRRRAAVTAMLLSEKFVDGDDALDMCRFWQYS